MRVSPKKLILHLTYIFSFLRELWI